MLNNSGRAALKKMSLSIALVGLLLLPSVPAVLAASGPSGPQVYVLPALVAKNTGGGHGGGGGGGGHGGFTCPTISGADQSVCSTNWSGYADTPSSAVTSVSGTWTVPTLSCPSSGTTYVALWVGIDGYTSGTVEQTGVMGVCSNGAATYSAWYEFYPNPSVTIAGFTVKPGDTVSASVTYSASTGKFTTTITDGTHSSTASAAVSGAAQSSAEWVVERPALCTGFHCRLTTLANFGSTPFASASATVGGSSGSISSFSDVAITMVGGSSGPVLAEPSPLNTVGSSFSVAYG